MKKRLIVHIGMHKTGTSSVQRYFSRNRAMLGRMGVCYPHSFGPKGERQPKHAAIFDAISHLADHGAPDPVLGPAESVIERAAAEIESASARVALISAEGLSGERPVFAKALASLEDRFETTIVIFLRRQDHWLESFYKQMVLSRQVRESRDFHNFASAPETRDHLNYERIVGWWQSSFRDVRIFGFHPTGSLRPLARLLDVAEVTRAFHWLPFAHAHENPSPGADAVEIVRRWNAEGVNAPRDAALRIEAKLGASDRRYFTLKERAQLLRDFEKGNQRLLRQMPKSDHSCLCPNMTELGRSRELRWTGDISAHFSPNSFHLAHSKL